MLERVVASLHLGDALERLHKGGELHLNVSPDSLVWVGTGQWTLRRGSHRHYMAPELLAAGQAAGPVCDVFSFGVTMLTTLLSLL